MTKEQIEKRVRQQIIWAIEDDLPGGIFGERLMKECWEDIGVGAKSFDIACTEMRRIINMLKDVDA